MAESRIRKRERIITDSSWLKDGRQITDNKGNKVKGWEGEKNLQSEFVLPFNFSI
jgi:hypothetical protein